MRDVVITSAVRTAIGNFLGALSSFSATELGGKVIEEAVRRSRIDKKEVDEVIMGNVLPFGLGQNPARQAMIKAGLPMAGGAITVNKVCGSGLKAVMLAAQAIAVGDADVIVAGGMESIWRERGIEIENRTVDNRSEYRLLTNPEAIDWQEFRLKVILDRSGFSKSTRRRDPKKAIAERLQGRLL